MYKIVLFHPLNVIHMAFKHTRPTKPDKSFRDLLLSLAVAEGRRAYLFIWVKEATFQEERCTK